MKKSKKIPIFVITGYLGSGKTTLLNELISQENKKIALIVNDMGSVNIDASLLKKGNVTKNDYKMVELQNGCICCTLREEFMKKIDNLCKDSDFDAIFVEASGISEPSSIAQGFITYEEINPNTNASLKAIISVVDASRIYNEFLSDLQGKLENEIDEEADIINLIIDQIEFCNKIILNKCDLLDEEQLLEVIKTIRQIQPEATIIKSIYGKIELNEIINDNKFDFEKVMNSSTINKALELNNSKNDDKVCYEEYGIHTFVYEEKRPFNRKRFIGFLENNYPKSLIRTKGHIWFSDDWIHVYLFEQAGLNATVDEWSNWVASFEAKEQKELQEEYPEILDDWDSEYGDRKNQIVFIGKDYSEEEIISALNSCIDCKKYKAR